MSKLDAILRGARIIQDALGIESDDVASYVFPRLGRPIASSALASSASGCRPRRASWPDAQRPPLSAAVVRRGNGRLLHRAGLRPRIRLTIRQRMQVLDEWPA